MASDRFANVWNIPRLEMNLSPQTPLACGVNRYPRKPFSMYDMHYALEMGVVFKGRMRRVYREYEMVVPPGDVWFCGMWEPHGCQCLCDDVEVLVFTIWPPLLANLRWPEAPDFNWMLPFIVPPKDRPRVKAKSRPWFATLPKRVREWKSETETRRKMEWRLCLLEILMRATRGWSPPTNHSEAPADAFARVNRAIEMVFRHRRLVTAEEVAKVCGMSRNRFSRLFQEVTGIGFPAFALRYRVSGAANQLACGDAAVKAVARHWGFADDSHLHKVFVEHYGLTPTEYRRDARKR
ncbi:MAG: helix-turn-helix transcriptional regulator [Phycisphaerae bacterium]|nr:helix-turn-helix transcriptional regulator [Phycisphaerae bacterium]